MVAEASQIALFSGIDEFAFVERHEIEVLDALVVIIHHSTPKVILVDYFADVFEDKFVRAQVTLGTKAVAFLIRLNDGDIGILSLLEALVATLIATSAIANTFHLRGTVNAVRIFPAGSISAIFGVCENIISILQAV